MDKVLIIAEAGVNNNGRLDLSYQLVDKAVEAGADIIKFQTGKPEKVASKFASQASYQEKNTGVKESQLDMIKKLMMPYDDFIPLKEYCDKKGIQFLSTPFEIDSIHFLNKLVSFWKIPSGEITNLPYLVEIARTGKPVIMSTGMSSVKEIKDALFLLKKYGTKDISLLHCTTQYPAPYNSVNLKAMITLQKEFGCRVGYSDHTLGIEVPLAAVAMGATIIEKHFTLNRSMSGPDHKASLEPEELKRMVESIRHIEKAMGTGLKEPSPAEIPNIVIARKSIVAKYNIKKGDIFTEENLTTKRPGNGISPMDWFKVLGTKAVRDFAEDELIEL